MKLALVVAIILMATVVWAGDKEELQLQLEKAILTLSNVQLQFQLRMADDPAVISAKQSLQIITQDIAKKGYEIRQSKNGFEVVKKEKK